MRFFNLCAVALSTLASLVVAGENPIIEPAAGSTIQAGSTVEVKWQPTTGGTVSLILRYGPSNNLFTGDPVTSQVPNSGSYSWTVPPNIANGQWSIAITDGKTTDTNYSPMFNVIGGTGSQGSPGSAVPASEAKAVVTTSTTMAGSSTVVTTSGSVSTTTVPGSSSTLTTKTGVTTTTSVSTSVSRTQTAATTTTTTATGAAARLGLTEGLAAVAGLGALAALA